MSAAFTSAAGVIDRVADGLTDEYRRRTFLWSPHVQAIRAAYPDFHYTVDEVIAEGDKVVLRVTASGTQRGEFSGMPATGKSATWSEMHIARMTNGQLVEHWAVQDQLGMLQHLGIIPAQGQA